jgi:hypothetical protein
MTQEELALMESSERSELIVVRTLEEKLEIIDERFSYPHQSGRNYEHSYMGEVRQIAASTLNLSEPDHAVSITLTRSDCAPTYLRNVMTFFVDGTTPFFMIKSVGDYYKKYIPEEAAKTIDIPGQDPEGWREISELRRPGQFKGTDIELLCEYIRYTFNCCIGRRQEPIVL